MAVPLAMLLTAAVKGTPAAVVGTNGPATAYIYYGVVGAFAIVPTLTLIFFRGAKPAK